LPRRRSRCPIWGSWGIRRGCCGRSEDVVRIAYSVCGIGGQCDKGLPARKRNAKYENTFLIFSPRRLLW
jgi:hypothetical protein